MNLSGNTILITGGSNGIGLAFAERFLKLGNKVIICGRREEKLESAKSKYPELHIKKCDVSVESERIELFEYIQKEFPELNVLVNNAGIQNRTNLLEANNDWKYYQQEIAINFEAPTHLSMLFLSHLVKKENAAIINVSSGLAFVPMAAAPIYCATKAAVHSFTMSLRQQLSKTNVEVIEVAPPAVNTDLCRPGLHTFGAPIDEFADGIFNGLQKGLNEIGYSYSEKSLRLSRDEVDVLFEKMNSNIPV